MDHSNNELYKNVIINTLQKIVPCDCSIDEFPSLLPLVTSKPSIVYCDDTPCQISFYLVSQYRSNAFKFFFEMISRWLVPGKQLNVFLLYTANFRVAPDDPVIYSVCEIKVRIEEQNDLAVMMRNLPIVETELRLGIGSSYYARRILEIKGMQLDEKISFLHETIARCIDRFPQIFHGGLLREMQQVLLLVKEEFKDARVSRHLFRIILYHYLFRKEIEKAAALEPLSRHIKVKLFRVKRKQAVAAVVGLNFLHGKEVCDEKNLLAAIQNYLPKAQMVVNSFVANRHGSENVTLLYVEVEKSDGAPVTSEELKILRKQLPHALKECVEPMMHPVLMPCNEEENMRNILRLSNEIKYLRDLPQAFISFDQQTQDDLYFSAVIVRVLKPGALPLKELLTGNEYLHDRCKKVGYIRKKYEKEASVFRIRLSKERFLRKDRSIDLYKARKTVVAELVKALGEIRDYNGGMISKQHELLAEVRRLLEGEVEYDDLLLDNFFYSLYPVVMRSVLDAEALKTLFAMQMESLGTGKEGHHLLNLRVEERRVFAMIATDDQGIKEELSRTIGKFSHQSNEIASSYVKVYGTNCIGYIFYHDDEARQQEFCQLLQNLLSR